MAPKKEPDPFDKEVGGRVREAREHKEMPQAELGRRLKFPHPSSIYRNEAGLRGFTKPQLVEIAKILHVSLDWLLTGRASPYGAPGELRNPAAVAETTAPTYAVLDTTAAQLKPVRTAIPKILRQLYTSGQCGDVDDEDEAFLLEYIAKPGNHGKTPLDLERALKADRYTRDGSNENFLALQEVNERQQGRAGVQRRTSDLPPAVTRRKASNDGKVKKLPQRRKSDR